MNKKESIYPENGLALFVIGSVMPRYCWGKFPTVYANRNVLFVSMLYSCSILLIIIVDVCIFDMQQFMWEVIRHCDSTRLGDWDNPNIVTSKTQAKLLQVINYKIF